MKTILAILLCLPITAAAQQPSPEAIAIAILIANGKPVPDVAPLPAHIPCGVGTPGANYDEPAPSVRPINSPPSSADVPPTEPPAERNRPAASKPMMEAELSADAQPTPWPGVAAMLNELKPKPNEVLLDPGCGYDARLLINACRFFGVEKAIGVEIDPAIAESARRHVAEAGLSDQIEIIDGDSTTLDVDADIGVAYLWPDTLKNLKPKIEQLDRFVSYAYAVPGLPMQAKPIGGGMRGNVYAWKKPPKVVRVPITQSFRRTVGLPRGSYCEVCGGRCSNPMAHVTQQRVVGYRDIAVADAVQHAVAPQPRTGHWENYRWRACPNCGWQIKRRWVWD